MRNQLLAILLAHFGMAAFAQTAPFPFELERFGPDAYKEIAADIDGDANALGTAYFQLYKKQRALNPSRYFPAPTLKQKGLATALYTGYPESMAAALVAFLETGGSLESCAALVERSPDFAPALPYRFLAAFAMRKPQLEREALQAMSNTGVLGPFLKAFGQNLLISSPDAGYIVTNGMQDLMAVRAAQLLDGHGAEMQVYNVLTESFPAWTGAQIEALLNDETKKTFVVPTMTPAFLEKHQANLWLSGLGYVHAKGPDPDSKLLIDAALRTIRQFQITPLPKAEKNPANKGIALVYAHFLEDFKDAIQTHGQRSDRKKAEEIATWLNDIQNP